MEQRQRDWFQTFREHRRLEGSAHNRAHAILPFPCRGSAKEGAARRRVHGFDLRRTPLWVMTRLLLSVWSFRDMLQEALKQLLTHVLYVLLTNSKGESSKYLRRTFL
mmetsp:Transcript_38439/g.121080  ORF Transcript_38439/g.121080 Transcript_38439/m.121080 type:complete len:107 (+) Transcript_38439:129-449(+)